MKKVKLNLTAQNLVQFNEGEHEGIRDGGDLYILFSKEEDGEQLIAAPAPIQKEAAAPPPAPAQEVKQEAPTQDTPTQEAAPTQSQATGSATWTDAHMRDNLDTTALKVECDNLGIDYASQRGANTNKKLRTLILDYYKSNAGVVDDTAPAQTAPAQEEAPKQEGPVEIPRSEWRNLKEGQAVLASMSIEGIDPNKLWDAEVTEWKKPEGMDTEELYVFFTEDEEEEYLRENDRLFYKPA